MFAVSGRSGGEATDRFTEWKLNRLGGVGELIVKLRRPPSVKSQNPFPTVNVTCQVNNTVSRVQVGRALHCNAPRNL